MATNYNPRITTNGLVLYLDAANARSYPGTGTTWSDLSGTGNHATMVNSPNYVTNNNGGFLIDGVDDHFDLTAASLLPVGSADRTIVAFVKTPSTWTEAYQHVVHYGTAVQDQAFGLAIQNNRLATHPWNGTPTSNTIISNSTYYCLAVAYRQSDSKHLFWINGIKDSSEVVRAINTGTTDARIAARISSPIEDWNADGEIYGVLAYNRVLTDAEISQNYQALRDRYGI